MLLAFRKYAKQLRLDIRGSLMNNLKDKIFIFVNFDEFKILFKNYRITLYNMSIQLRVISIFFKIWIYVRLCST